MIVLVVEDSSTMRQLVCQALGRLDGVVAIEASDGLDGLAKLAEIQVDAIMTDINMPVMDGFTFIERLRALPAHRTTPVIILTTEVAEHDRARALALGVTTYVTKPVQQNDIRAALASVIGTPRTTPPPEAGPIVLHVDYRDAADLSNELTHSLSSGEICLSNTRALPRGTRVRLALTFPGLAQPIQLDGLVLSASHSAEPTITIGFSVGPQLELLVEVVERIRAVKP